MNFNTYEVVEDSLIIFGVALSISQLYTILGIVLLSVQITMIVVKSGIVVYKHIKNKNYKGAIDTLTDAKDKIQTLVDNHKNGDKQDSK